MNPTTAYQSVLPSIIVKGQSSKKAIEKRNKAFNALSKEAQRREIALDALNLIISENVRASDGCYWSPAMHEIADGATDSHDFQLKLLDGLPNPTGCEVCARGAMMLSTVRLGNTIDPNCEESYSKGHYNNLKGFCMESFQDMEAEYENSAFQHPYYCNTKEKLMNILLNVLVNGDFDTDDDTDYVKQFSEENNA